MFLFGLHTDEIARVRAEGYWPDAIARSNPELQRVFDKMNAGFADGKSYSDLVSSLLYGGDQYMLLADYPSYVECRDRLYSRIADEGELARLAIINTARSGIFAADRAVKEYGDNIWHV